MTDAADTFADMRAARAQDNGLWYVPTVAEYPRGGYEVGVTFAADRGPAGEKHGCAALEAEYRAAIADLLEVPAERCQLPEQQLPPAAELLPRL